jgi:hypothetical protein
MTGALDVPLGPAGASWSIEVELLYDGPVGHDPLGGYVGEIRLDSGLKLDAGLAIDSNLGSGVYAGSVGVTFGNLVGGASVNPILYDPDANVMEFGYVSDPIAWNDDPQDMRVIEVAFEGSFAPAVIFHKEAALPDLVPQPQPIQLSTLRLDPVGPPAPLALQLDGELDVRFTDGRAPRERGTIALTRLDTGCN